MRFMTIASALALDDAGKARSHVELAERLAELAVDRLEHPLPPVPKLLLALSVRP